MLVRVHAPLMEFAELERAQGEGIDLARPNGFLRLAYRDEADDGPVFCRVYLPFDYDPAKEWPMVISLHGFNYPNPPYVQWGDVDKRHDPSPFKVVQK